MEGDSSFAAAFSTYFLGDMPLEVVARDQDRLFCFTRVAHIITLQRGAVKQ
jgi:hypothetical protein